MHHVAWRTHTNDDQQAWREEIAAAGEVMAAVQTATLVGLPCTALRDAILTHPTMAEGLGSLYTNVPAKATRSPAHA